MSFHFRPAVRENTPLIIGIAGPTKSGKTYSAHRLARGLAPSGEIIMLNAEGAKGHQYADRFKYTACDLVPPYRYGMYEEVLREAYARKPGAIIVDSISHAHDGPGGFLEWHEEELDRIAGKDFGKRDKANFTAWIKPKAAENAYRYALQEAPCPVLLCMRAKEKLKIVTGKPPIDLGWQPIVGEGLAFETIFTLMLPPHSRGVPDLEISELREPFDALIPKGKPIDEELGTKLAEWARGRAAATAPDPKAEALATIKRDLAGAGAPAIQAKVAKEVFSVDGWKAVEALPLETLLAAITPAEGADISRLEAACITAKESAA